MEKYRLSKMPSGHDGDGYITVDGKVLSAFRIAKISAKLETVTESRRFLGERMTQNSPRGLSGAGSISYYHTTAALIDAMKKYSSGGSYPDITIQYHSEGTDGRCEVVLRRVMLEEVMFGALDDSSNDSIINECGFSFDDFDIIERF